MAKFVTVTVEKGTRKLQMPTYNKTNVFDFSDPHIDLLTLVNRQADVEKIVLMGHAANLHEGQQVTLIVTSLVFVGLENTQQHTISGLKHIYLKTTDFKCP